MVASSKGRAAELQGQGQPARREAARHGHRRHAGEAHRRGVGTVAEEAPRGHLLARHRLLLARDRRGRARDRGREQEIVAAERVEHLLPDARPGARGLMVERGGQEARRVEPPPGALVVVARPLAKPAVMAGGALGVAHRHEHGAGERQRRERHLLHRGAELHEDARRLLDRRVHLGVGARQRGLGQLADEADAEPADLPGEGGAIVGHGAATRQRILRIVSGEDAEHDRAVLDGARERPRHVHGPAHREAPVTRDQSPRRAHAHRAAIRGGDADRAAGVLAEGERGERGGGGHAGSARGAAGLAIGVPRVPRLAEREAHGAAEGELRHVELADQDGARRPEPRHHGGVLGGHVRLEDARARGRPEAGGVELVLHGHRQAVERAALAAPRERALGLARRGARLVGAHRDEGAEPRVQPLDAREIHVDEVDRRHLLDAHEPRQRGGAEECELVARRAHAA